MSNVINEANWKFHWRLTESAGIMVYLANYKGRRVLWEGSLPYVTVDHQRLDRNLLRRHRQLGAASLHKACIIAPARLRSQAKFGQVIDFRNSGRPQRYQHLSILDLARKNTRVFRLFP